MTIVLLQTSLPTKIRLERVSDILVHCLLFKKKKTLNMDINKIIPVKISGVSPNLLNKSLTLP